jgi:DNA-binding NarL/FixJ family response regulator
MTSAPVKVIVADDDDSMRQVLGDLLSRQDQIELAGTVADGAAAVELATKVQPDVAIVDVRMPGGGTAGVRGILHAAPGCGVVALSAYEERSTVLEMLLAGASGYVVKGAPAAEIVEAIRRTARKQVSVSVEMVSGLIEELVHDIGELGRTQEVLHRSEERYASSWSTPRRRRPSAIRATPSSASRSRCCSPSVSAKPTKGTDGTTFGTRPRGRWAWA